MRLQPSASLQFIHCRTQELSQRTGRPSKLTAEKRTDREVGKTYILKSVTYSIHEASVYIRISVLGTGYAVAFKINVLSYFQGLAYKEIILFGLFPRTHSSKLHLVLDIN